jgi:uncharacterized oligopeptide transporter (OPT) family protein
MYVGSSWYVFSSPLRLRPYLTAYLPVGASNIYLGLKTGFTFGPQLFGAIFGFGILKPLSKIMYGRFPGWIGTDNFGPKENVTVQTAATAAGGIGMSFRPLFGTVS